MAQQPHVHCDTDANATEASNLVRRDGEYADVGKREGARGDKRLSATDWWVSPRLGILTGLSSLRRDVRAAHLNAKARSKVERGFYIVKNLFGCRKTRGLGKTSTSVHAVRASERVQVKLAGKSTSGGGSRRRGDAEAEAASTTWRIIPAVVKTWKWGSRRGF